MYKIPISLPDGTNINTYLTRDGKLFFPEAIDVDELTEKLAQENSGTNNQNNMELKTEILNEGSGDQLVAPGDNITVDYTGTLEDGTQFDSSVGKDPFTFTIGEGQVIQGWDQGLIGMKVGEERKLTIPSDLAYGSYGSGSIPPNATLIFTVKLISINSGN
ncbi:FKBP-type peptidyl-prolyl cis-trans isomerase [Patescibacteria group bacterium]|nr:FKBP-type peptidyl-prolyl cis-trans isomerase [Patescibacteria group bacterium]